MIALTVIAVGIGLALTTTTAHADDHGVHRGLPNTNHRPAGMPHDTTASVRHATKSTPQRTTGASAPKHSATSDRRPEKRRQHPAEHSDKAISDNARHHEINTNGRTAGRVSADRKITHAQLTISVAQKENKAVADDVHKIIKDAATRLSDEPASKINNGSASKIKEPYPIKISKPVNQTDNSPTIKINKTSGAGRSPARQADRRQLTLASTPDQPGVKSTDGDHARSSASHRATKHRPVRSAVQGTLRGARTIGETALRTTVGATAHTLEGAGMALSGDQPRHIKTTPDAAAKVASGSRADVSAARQSDRDQVTTVGRVLNASAIQPASHTVAAVGRSHPASRVIGTTTDLVDTAAGHPTRTVPELTDRLARTAPREVRPLVSQVGRTADQATAPVTALGDRAIRRTAPVLPVDDLATGVTATLRQLPADDVDAATERLVRPVADALHGTGRVVQDTVRVPLPESPVAALAGTADTLTGGLSEGVGGLSGGIADGLADVSGGLANTTDSVGALGTDSRSGADAILTPFAPSGAHAEASRVDYPAMSSDGRTDREPADSSPAPATVGQPALALPESESAVDRSLVLRTTDGQPAGSLAFVTTDVKSAGPGTGEEHSAGSAPADHHRQDGGVPAQTGGSAPNSTSGGGTGGTGQPAAPSSAVQLLDLPGSLIIGWGDDVRGSTTAYDPGFSPD
ncbi:MAG TPA: hypothetical protein VIP98_22670 [Microlunatus sp.]